MSREQVLALVRNHLADELDIEPEAIGEATRFKEDLEADSLDLYTLVQELEDVYGVRMSNEQAVKILTVGQAVDFVLAHAPDAAARVPDIGTRAPDDRARVPDAGAHGPDASSRAPDGDTDAPIGGAHAPDGGNG
jgi:acyl carrier protein